MSGAKEIRTKIKSIQNTQKITRAMEMVAASKMRRAQERMKATRPYSEKILNVIHHLAEANPEYRHDFLKVRPVKRIGLIVISTDRGLCGGLNANLFRTILETTREWQEKNVEVELCLIGSKAEGFFKRLHLSKVAQLSKLSDKPVLADFIGPVSVMLDRFQAGQIDALHLAFNTFQTTMSQKPTVQQILPVQNTKQAMPASPWDYIYEPDAKDLLDTLLVRFIESQVYQGVVENVACEQAARMVAMKSASDNAGDIISQLRLVYNKARQAAITREISEIVGGAAAVSG